MKTKRTRLKMLQKQAKDKKARQAMMLATEQLNTIIKEMMITSPIPWKVQEKTGDIVDAKGRFVARVGHGIDKFKLPIDYNNRDLIIKAVQFYMEQKELEAKKAAATDNAVIEPEVLE